jgi:hypothetical protein
MTMRKEIRRIVMFCTILTVGLLLLFIDVTFIQLLLLIIAIAIILPFLLGLVTPGEVKTAFTQFKDQKLTKIGFLKKLDNIKLFEKKASTKQTLPQPKAPAKPEASPQKPGTPAGGGGTARTMPFSNQINSLVSTLKSFTANLKARAKDDRNVGDINSMLDKTVSEKVEKSVPATPAAGSTSSPPQGGGGGLASSAEEDPFLSLSGDEFDAGLLDGLDDDGMGSLSATPGAPDMPGQSMDMGLPEPELSGAPADASAELDAAANDILKAHGGDEGLDEFKGLETEDGGTDADFGDLDNLSLDDVDLDADLDGMDTGAGGTATTAAPEPEAPGTGGAAAPPAESSGAVKTAWIPSDAPKGAEQQDDQIGTQADMASFAGGASGSDEDLLSSISSDVKRTVKEKDTSLLRELKDFKAPANEIEKELSDMFQKMSSVQKPKEKIPPGTNGVK